MRVLLVQPAIGGHVGFARLTQVEPLALECLAGALADHEVRLVDLRLRDDLDEVLASFRPHVCGLSCSYTVAVYSTLSCAMRIKGRLPECFVLVGGHHPSVLPEHFLHAAVDAVCIGEGEGVIQDVVRALDCGRDLTTVPGLCLNTLDGQLRTPRRAQVEDLDSLPVPRRSFARGKDDYYFHFWRSLALVETTRGCPYRCAFCSVWRFYSGTTRTKSAARVLSEIAAVREEKILVTDDNFFADVERAYELADLVRRERFGKQFSVQVRADVVADHPDLVQAWYEAGMRHVFLGLEAVSDESLERLRKESSRGQADRALEIVRSYGDIGITGSFIVDPDFMPEDFARLADYVRTNTISSPTFTVLTPLPGTSLFRERVGDLVTGNCECFDLLHSVLPTRLEPQQFAGEFAGLYHSAYRYGSIFSKRALRIIGKLLMGRYSLRHVLNVLAAFRSMYDLECFLVSSSEAPASMPDMRAAARRPRLTATCEGSGAMPSSVAEAVGV